MGELVDVNELAEPFLEEIRAEVAQCERIRLVGVMGTRANASDKYAGYAASGCAKVGIEFELRHAEPEAVSHEIFRACEDPEVHGILVFYPVFGGARDRSLQNEVVPEKDVEGLHSTWTRCLYHDQRTLQRDGAARKAVLPCTPLGILKILTRLGALAEGPPRELARGRTVTIFNRSEVVGRPLAAMLAHDGARVHSFDIEGHVLYQGLETKRCEVSRADALAASQIVISGVPSRDFERIHKHELQEGAVVVDFSHVRNIDKDVVERASHVVRRVGPMTIAMLLRNTVQLYRSFKA
ncbi:MAG TPA: methylenetetrahydrofolate dehydrogenase [Planctomycetes bacterium]|nr:methylenetetrahydrofolate dehydrogenase [Planctomycetota bacterium]